MPSGWRSVRPTLPRSRRSPPTAPASRVSSRSTARPLTSSGRWSRCSSCPWCSSPRRVPGLAGAAPTRRPMLPKRTCRSRRRDRLPRHAFHGADITGSTTMSDEQPPAGTPEYLDSSGDDWVPPGPGEAEAPSGRQKIDAFRTLNKFPAFKDKVGIHSVDDVRQKLGDELIKSLGCDGLTFDHDIDPWLGNRAAVAAVDVGKASPEPISVVQVTDDGKAEDALKKLVTCSGSQGDVFYDVHDGWAVFAGSQQAADQVVSETDHASLADDDTYQKWTTAAGDSGVVSCYAAPAAGDYLAHQLGDLENNLGGLGLVPDPTQLGTSGSFATTSAYHASLTTDTSGLDRALKDFQGAAATIRFTGDGLELATVSDPSLSQSSLASDQGGAVVQNLPDDTAAAIGVGLESGWLAAF